SPTGRSTRSSRTRWWYWSARDKGDTRDRFTTRFGRLLCLAPSRMAHNLPPISGARRGTQPDAREPIAMPTTDPSRRGWAAGLAPRALVAILFLVAVASPSFAQPPVPPAGVAGAGAPVPPAFGPGAPPVPGQQKGGGEVNLKLPDLNQVKFFGIGGRDLLFIGLVVSLGGLAFGLQIYSQLKSLPVHKS